MKSDIDKNLSPPELAAVLAMARKNIAALKEEDAVTVSKNMWGKDLGNSFIFCFICNDEVPLNKMYYSSAHHARQHIKHLKIFL